MLVTGALATAGAFLLAFQFVSPFGQGSLGMVPLLLGLVCLALATLRGLIQGPAPARRAVALGLCSMFCLAFGLMFMTIGGPGVRQGPSPNAIAIAASGAFFVLAVTQYILAVRAERSPQ